MDIHVFQVNDYDWWAGTDTASIRPAYQKFNGFRDVDMDEDTFYMDVDPLSDEAMNRLVFTDTEGYTPDHTFKEELDAMIARGQEFPCFFASTEY